MYRLQHYFYPTYKELKLDWKYNFGRCSRISILPIRNWNAIYVILPELFSVNFYPTYKELKLNTHMPTWLQKYYFYPTYKELKPNRYTVPFNTVPDFYPTYKELKRSNYRGSGRNTSTISILPIRNWNFCR